MLKSNLVRKQDAKLHYEIMAYLIRQFGPPPRPTIPVQSNKAPLLQALSWTDINSRSIFDWAEDQFNLLKSECHMDSYDIDLVPSTDGLCTNQIAATRRLEILAAGRMPYRKTKVASIFYDPKACSIPGYFSTMVLLKLANLRAKNFEPKINTTDFTPPFVALTTAVYNRQGFTLARHPHHVSTYLTSAHNIRPLPQRSIINALCFSTCLALRIRRQSIEQILMTYDGCMTKSLKRKFRQASQQIDMNTETLAILRMLSEQKTRPKNLKQRA